jgi:molecular chaperone GrpE
VTDHAPADPAEAEPTAGTGEPVDAEVIDEGVELGSAPSEGPGGEASDREADVERSELEVAAAQRDEYLDHLRRVQAEFENYRKRIARQQTDAVDQAASRLVEALLPVLDACDGAVRHGAEEVQPIYAALLGTLEKEGLERIDPSGEAFDPTLHEAVMHEPAEGGEGPVVSDVLRPGYGWKGRVLRPAMVKVKG